MNLKKFLESLTNLGVYARYIFGKIYYIVAMAAIAAAAKVLSILYELGVIDAFIEKLQIGIITVDTIITECLPSILVISVFLDCLQDV